MEREILHTQYITDVALDISQSNCWRELLFSAGYGERFAISLCGSACEIPEYLYSILSKHKLSFYVSKVNEVHEEFDKDAIVFKFEAVDFPNIMRYSANYLPGTAFVNGSG